MRHLITVTPRIAEALAATFTLHPHITAIGTADPDISIIGIRAGIVISKVARSPRAARRRGFQPRCWSAGVALNAAAMAIAARSTPLLLAVDQAGADLVLQAAVPCRRNRHRWLRARQGFCCGA